MKKINLRELYPDVIQMTVNEIAEVEGVDPSRVRDSIRRGLKQLEKFF